MTEEMCYFCTKSKHESRSVSFLPKGTPTQEQAFFDMEPCFRCKELSEGRVLVFGVESDSSPEPIRTGTSALFTQEQIRKEMPDSAEKIINQGVIFMLEEELIGLMMDIMEAELEPTG
jgi:hypothetical protein